MKKIFILVVAVVLLGSLSTPSFALLRGDKKLVKGTIQEGTSPKTMTIVIKEDGGKILTYKVKKAYDANFAPGTRVGLIVDTKADPDIVTRASALRKGR